MDYKANLVITKQARLLQVKQHLAQLVALPLDALFWPQVFFSFSLFQRKKKR
jgi:hypothetical protein